MKEKVIIFIVGLLLGAIISTGSIYVYTVANSSNNNSGNNTMQMPNDSNSNGNNPMGENGGTPPAMPGNRQNNNQM